MGYSSAYIITDARSKNQMTIGKEYRMRAGGTLTVMGVVERPAAVRVSVKHGVSARRTVLLPAVAEVNDPWTAAANLGAGRPHYLPALMSNVTNYIATFPEIVW